MVLDGPINGDWCEACVAQVLVPELGRGAIVIMDNLSSHKRSAVRERIEGGGRNRALPAAIHSRLQSHREGVLTAQGHAGKRTVSGLWDLIGKLVDIFQPDECAKYCNSCAYEPK